MDRAEEHLAVWDCRCCRTWPGETVQRGERLDTLVGEGACARPHTLRWQRQQIVLVALVVVVPLERAASIELLLAAAVEGLVLVIVRISF